MKTGILLVTFGALWWLLQRAGVMSGDVGAEVAILGGLVLIAGAALPRS